MKTKYQHQNQNESETSFFDLASKKFIVKDEKLFGTVCETANQAAQVISELINFDLPTFLNKENTWNHNLSYGRIMLIALILDRHPRFVYHHSLDRFFIDKSRRSPLFYAGYLFRRHRNYQGRFDNKYSSLYSKAKIIIDGRWPVSTQAVTDSIKSVAEKIAPKKIVPSYSEIKINLDNLNKEKFSVHQDIFVEVLYLSIDRAFFDRVFLISKKIIKSRSREGAIVGARFAFYFFCRSYDKNFFLLSKIGELVGKRTHATVLHGIKRCRNLMEKDPSYRAKMHEAGKILSESLKNLAAL